MGPAEKMTGFRDFGSESVPREKWLAFKSIGYCNWVQRMEGNLDTSHISWLHQFNGALRLPGRRHRHSPAATRRSTCR